MWPAAIRHHCSASGSTAAAAAATAVLNLPYMSVCVCVCDAAFLHCYKAKLYQRRDYYHVLVRTNDAQWVQPAINVGMVPAERMKTETNIV